MIATVPTRDILIRPARPDDQAFVAATMSEQLQRGRHDDANALVDRVLDSNAVRVIVATEHGRIVGWLAYSAIPRVRPILFLYVRRNDRLQGVARQLIYAAWPTKRGQYVHAGLRGVSTKSMLQRFSAIEMPLEDLL